MDAELPDLLPPLRDDLRLHEAAPHPDGSPSWTIQDPVANIFYRIGWLEFELLARWHLGTPAAVLAGVAGETPLEASPEELATLLAFLAENHLLAIRSPGHADKLLEIYRSRRLSRLKWLLHHYLFFRIPLWHPDRWLAAALPWVGWIFRRETAWATATLCLAGIVLTGRQIDVFAASFVETLSPGGLAGYLLALACTKSLHELGHAFTATRHGVRVAHMGVAFLVLWPVLYTDTGESWRLRDRRRRLAISSAGIITELAIAGLATLAWNLTPPGELRQALFFLATTAWLISLGLNASPFMRFDGYFILSDLLDLPNLHERAGALARAWLRNTLLAWQEPDPEYFPPRQRRLLIAFALVTWIYRLAVYLGIAAAVYFLFFKLLGIFLFIVEVAWFIVRPFASEFRVWHARRAEIATSRRRIALAALSVLGIVALVPWNTTVSAPAWLYAENSHTLYSPSPARIVALHAPAGPVAAGQALMTLEQPESALRTRLAEAGSNAIEHQLAGLLALPDGENRRLALERQRAMKLAEASAERDEQNRLILRAPAAGRLSDIDPDLAVGVWVSPRQPLATVHSNDRWLAEIFVSQDELGRIAAGDRVRFYPATDRLFPLEGRVVDIDRNRLALLPHPLLSSRHGGSIPILAEHGGLTPRDALYRVRVRLEAAPSIPAQQRGTAVIDAAPHSFLLDMLRAVLVVIVREASF